MSLKSSLIGAIPYETVCVACAAFPKGNLYISMRDELDVLFEDSDFDKVHFSEIFDEHLPHLFADVYPTPTTTQDVAYTADT